MVFKRTDHINNRVQDVRANPGNRQTVADYAKGGGYIQMYTCLESTNLRLSTRLSLLAVTGLPTHPSMVARHETHMDYGHRPCSEYNP